MASDALALLRELPAQPVAGPARRIVVRDDGRMRRTERDAAWAGQRGWSFRPAIYDRIALVLSGLAIVVGVGMLVAQHGPAVGYVSLGVTAVGIVVTRRFPWPGLIVVLLGCTWGLLVWNPVLPWTIAVLTVFSVTVRGSRALLAGLVTGVTMYLVEVYLSEFDWLSGAALAAFSLSLAAAGLGSAILHRDRYWAALELRARDAVASRESEANRRVAEERIRISRDLHDVVGHQVAIVSVQLGVAEVNLPTNVEASRVALEAARTGLQSVLRETQAILAVLRRGDSTSDEDAPTPGVADLPGLIASYEAIGLDVDATIGTIPGELAATVDTAVFRIVQEALTNAHRHGVGTVHLTVSASGGIITIESRNSYDEEGDPPVRRGFGLVGMHERAQSAGGTVVIGDDGATFAVTVTLRVDGRVAQ